MKYLVVSDIHGRQSSAKKIEDLILNNNFDKVILLGDLLYHGPRNLIPSDYDVVYVYETLNKYHDKIIWVKGNCDSEVDEMVLNFSPVIESYLVSDYFNIYLCHGHKLNFSTDNFSASCCLYGHYHIPSIKQIHNKKYINVGSISLPKENSARTYAVILDNKIKIYDINDIEILNDEL